MISKIYEINLATKKQACFGASSSDFVFTMFAIKHFWH